MQFVALGLLSQERFLTISHTLALSFRVLLEYVSHFPLLCMVVLLWLVSELFSVVFSNGVLDMSFYVAFLAKYLGMMEC